MIVKCVGIFSYVPYKQGFVSSRLFDLMIYILTNIFLLVFLFTFFRESFPANVDRVRNYPGRILVLKKVKIEINYLIFNIFDILSKQKYFNFFLRILVLRF